MPGLHAERKKKRDGRKEKSSDVRRRDYDHGHRRLLYPIVVSVPTAGYADFVVEGVWAVGR